MDVSSGSDRQAEPQPRSLSEPSSSSSPPAEQRQTTTTPAATVEVVQPQPVMGIPVMGRPFSGGGRGTGVYAAYTEGVVYDEEMIQHQQSAGGGEAFSYGVGDEHGDDGDDASYSSYSAESDDDNDQDTRADDGNNSSTPRRRNSRRGNPRGVPERRRRSPRPAAASSIYIQSQSPHIHSEDGGVDAYNEGGLAGTRDYIVAPREDGGAAVLAVDHSTGRRTVFVVPAEGEGSHVTVASLSGPAPAGVNAATLSALRAGVNEDVNLAWRMSRTIRLYAAGDLVLCLLSMLSWIWFALLVLFPIIGFVGAFRYRLSPILVFIVYFPIAIAFRLYITFGGVRDEEYDKDTTMKGISMAFAIITCLLEVYCMRLVVLFFRHLRNKLTQQDRDDLAGGTAPVDPRYSWW